MNKSTIFVIAAVVTLLWGMTAQADVMKVGEPLTVDGKLDEAAWAAAKWETGFTPLSCADYKTVSNQTAFAILADETTLYVGIKGQERNIPFIRSLDNKNSPWTTDDVELFLSPANDPACFYQFALIPGYGTGCCVYHEECGNIHPDPYAPEWNYAVAYVDEGWTIEIAIPLSAFYMTRNRDWKTTWRVNMSRANKLAARPSVYHHSSWSPLEYKFIDPVHFRTLSGFPIRADVDDVAIRSVKAEITGSDEKGLVGELRLSVYAGTAGEYAFSSPNATSKKVTLVAGDNVVVAPCRFEKNARYDVPVALTRAEDGHRFARTYPVAVDYDALRVKFTTPAYRDNFYPGQDSSRIVGRVQTTLKDAVKVALDCPGVGHREVTVGSDATFDFDTKDFKAGTAKLTFTCGRETRVREVQIVKPIPGQQMSWVENGNLVIDGKPVFRRTIYGDANYCCSKQFAKRAQKETLYQTPISIRGVEFGRLVPGSENAEGIFDVEPSQKVKDAIDKRLNELMALPSTTGWYLSDEPECRGVSPVYLRNVYNYIKSKDPRRVCVICSRDPERYIDACDVIQPHPYLAPRFDDTGARVYGVPLERFGSYFEGAAKMNRSDKVLENVSSAFGYRDCNNLAADYPTFDELVASMWAVVCEGCKGFHPFIYNALAVRAGLLEGVRYMFSSVEELENRLLFGRRTRIAKSDLHVAATWDCEGDTLLAVVNFTPAVHRVWLTGVKGPFYEYRGTRVFRNKWGTSDMEIELRPFETVVATTDRMTAASQLPSTEDVRRLVAAADAERLSRDNQILERAGEIRCYWSGMGDFPFYAVTDGVLDQQAYVFRGNKGWVELEFSNTPISFREVRLYGEKLDRTEVSVWKDGVWQPLGVSRRTYANAMLRFVAREVTTATKVRLAFPQDGSEVFEFEFPYLEK